MEAYPENRILTEEEMLAFQDANGNLVAPPGYSFVQVDLNSPYMQTPTGFETTPEFFAGNYTPLNTPHTMSTPHFNTYYGENPMLPPASRFQQNMHHGMPSFRPPKHQQTNIKEKFVELVYEALTTASVRQGIWVEQRTEDEGFYSVRVHAKKKQDIALLPIIIQKIHCEIGLVEFSMHYLKRKDRKNGITIYLRTRSRNEDTVAALAEFNAYDVKADRVREPTDEDLLKVSEAPRRKSNSRLSLALIGKNANFTECMQKIQKSMSRSWNNSKSADENLQSHMRLDMGNLDNLKPSRTSSDANHARLAKAKIARPLNSPEREFEDEDFDFDKTANESVRDSLSISQPKKKSQSLSGSMKKLSVNAARKASVLVSDESRGSSITLKLLNGKSTIVTVPQKK